MSRKNEEVDEAEFEESGDPTDETAAPRSLRPSELMFSTTGRIAMGVFGVLLFLGGVAAVSGYVFDDPKPVASKKNSATEKSKSAAKSTETPAPASDEPLAQTQPSEIVPTAGAFEADASSRAAPLAKRPSGDDRYRNWQESSPFSAWDSQAAESPPAEAPVAETPPETDPAVEHTAEAEPAPAAFAPAVTPVSSAPPRELPAEPVTTRAPTRNYQVRAGESVFDIARYELGDAVRWIEVYDLNAAALKDQLEELPGGLRLAIPQR